MNATRPPAPTTPAVGPATCAAAAELATRAADLLEPHAVATDDEVRPSEREYRASPGADRAEAARLLRAAADLVHPAPAPGPVMRGSDPVLVPAHPAEDARVAEVFRRHEATRSDPAQAAAPPPGPPGPRPPTPLDLDRARRDRPRGRA